MQYRIPVDQSLATVNQSFLVQPHEHLDHGCGQALVHRESVARPVDGIPESPHLAADRATRLFFPLPDPVDKRFPAEVMPVLPLRVELSLYDHLGGNAGVIGARLPQGPVAFHPVETGQSIHQRVLESVPHVQRARYIGRRDHDAVSGARAGRGEPAG